LYPTSNKIAIKIIATKLLSKNNMINMPTAIIKQPKPIIFFTYTESRHSILVVVYDKKAKSIIYCWNNTGIKV